MNELQRKLTVDPLEVVMAAQIAICSALSLEQREVVAQSFFAQAVFAREFKGDDAANVSYLSFLEVLGELSRDAVFGAPPRRALLRDE